PASLLSRSGIVRSASIGLQQIAGMVLAAVGAAIVLWCILSFSFIGKGTPAPFDPPRRLVTRAIPVHGEFVIMPPGASEIIRDNVFSIDMTSTSRTHWRRELLPVFCRRDWRECDVDCNSP